MSEYLGAIRVQGSPAAVFACWADASGWARWDPDVKAASMDGPFAAGTTGRITPRAGPTMAIRLTRVEPDRAFDAEARLPLCTMRFEHWLEPSGPETLVTHRVVLSGPLAFLFRRIIGPQLTRGIPGTMAGLKRAVEAARPAAPPGA
jgi:uncharacterized protein YndB with AHSA1/START domain